MLSVFLLILKISGIVIASILGLALLIVAAVLFVPVRYKVSADYHEKAKARVNVSWLGILRFIVLYNDKLAMRAKVLFVTVYSNDKKASSKDKKHKKRKKHEKKNETSSAEENVFSISEEDARKLTEEEKPEIRMAEHDTQAHEDDGDTDERAGQPGDEIHGRDGTSWNSSERKFFEKIRTFVSSVYSKVKDIIRLILDTIKKVKGASDRLKEKFEKARTFVTDEDNKKLLHFIIAQIKALIKVIRPKKYKIEAKIGFEDPAVMGKVLAYVSIFYGISGVDLSLEPVFGENVKEGSVSLKGSIRIFSLLVIALRVYRNEQLKKFISR